MRNAAWQSLIRIALIIGTIGALALSSCSKSSEKSATPQIFGTAPRANLEGENDFAHLIQLYSQGRPIRAPWAGYWWPYHQNGIVDAATKYEQSTGQIGAVQWELEHHGADIPGILPWWGHCNGWAAAAILFNEPISTALHRGVAFSTGDQKALLSELGQETLADFFGTRTDTDDPSAPELQDIFPNQFFLVLTNLVGKGQSLIMDRYTGSQVWNHPIAGYRIDPITPADDLGADPSAPDIYRVMVTTTIWWVRDDVEPDSKTEPFNFTDGTTYQSRILKYEVWLDAPLRFDSSGKLVSAGKVVLSHQGNIVYGGAWRMSDADLLNSHPDYLWTPYSLAPATEFANPAIQPLQIDTILRRSL